MSPINVLEESDKINDDNVTEFLQSSKSVFPVVWDDEPSGCGSNFFRRALISEQDKFSFAKLIIPIVLFIYLFLLLVVCFCGNLPGVSLVWQSSSVFLQSIVVLIIGYYFSKK